MSADVAGPEHLALSILSPERVLYDGEAEWVQVPLVDGLIGIWPGHAPLIASLGRGRVQWETGQGVQDLPVAGGMLRVDTGRCVVLVGPSAAAEREASSWEVTRARATQTEALFEDLEEVLSDSLSDEEIRELQEE